MQYLYLKQDSGTDKFFIGLTNNFLRIYIDGTEYNYYEDFSSNSDWRYLSVSFYPISTTATKVQIFLDSTKFSVKTLYAVFSDSASYDIYVGKDFEGNIYSFEISPLLNVAMSLPKMISSSSCAAFGSTSTCSICPRSSTTGGD